MPNAIRPQKQVQYHLPDILRDTPLKGGMNPHYHELASESRDWINSYHLFGKKKQRDFTQCIIELLCAHVYPFASHEAFRMACDLVNVLFAVDEISDEQNGVDAGVTCVSLYESVNNPRLDDDSAVARFGREFRSRLVSVAAPNDIDRFVKVMGEYTRAVVVEARLREEGRVLSLKEYMPLRRDNSAVPLCLTLVEYILGIALPEDIFENKAFLKAYWAVCDHVCWSNDLYSYNREQSKGQIGNNVVTVLMRENGMSLQEACDYIGVKCQEIVSDYISARDEIQATIGGDIGKYVEAIGSWIIGNLNWSFDSCRYFGLEHEKVRQTLTLTLLPPEVDEDERSCSDSE